MSWTVSGESWFWNRSRRFVPIANGACWQLMYGSRTFIWSWFAEDSPERVLKDAKAYASRALNRAGLDGADQRRWTRHGSTRYLWKPEQVGAAIHYVTREQGKPMTVLEKSEGL